MALFVIIISLIILIVVVLILRKRRKPRLGIEGIITKKAVDGEKKAKNLSLDEEPQSSSSCKEENDAKIKNEHENEYTLDPTIVPEKQKQNTKETSIVGNLKNPSSSSSADSPQESSQNSPA